MAHNARAVGVLQSSVSRCSAARVYFAAYPGKSEVAARSRSWRAIMRISCGPRLITESIPQAARARRSASTPMFEGAAAAAGRAVSPASEDFNRFGHRVADRFGNTIGKIAAFGSWPDSNLV